MYRAVVDAVAAVKRAGNDPERQRAAHKLWRLAHADAANRDAIREAGGIPPLVALIWSGRADVKYYATGALRSLARNNAENKVAIRQAGGLGALVSTIDDGDVVKTAAASTLWQLSYDNDENAVATALARGRIEAIVELARRGSVRVGGELVVANAGAAVKRKATLVVATLFRDCVGSAVPYDMKTAIASYLYSPRR